MEKKLVYVISRLAFGFLRHLEMWVCARGLDMVKSVTRRSSMEPPVRVGWFRSRARSCHLPSAIVSRGSIVVDIVEF